MHGSAWLSVIGCVTLAVALRLLSVRNLRCHWCGVRLKAWEHPSEPCKDCKGPKQKYA